MGVSYGGLGHLLSQSLPNFGDALDKKLRAHDNHEDVILIGRNAGRDE
jgi:hypothetical protein